MTVTKVPKYIIDQILKISKMVQRVSMEEDKLIKAKKMIKELIEDD